MLITMLLPKKNEKNKNKKRRVEHNIFNNNRLSTSLILGVFTANSDARCLREKYERRFVKKKSADTILPSSVSSKAGSIKFFVLE